MRALKSILLCLLLVAATTAEARPRPHRATFPRTTIRGDLRPVAPALRPALPAPAPTLPQLAPSAAVASASGPSLGASRAPSRSVSYIQDRTGSVCRTTCATERYTCLAGPDPAECQTPWALCVNACS